MPKRKQSNQKRFKYPKRAFREAIPDTKIEIGPIKGKFDLITENKKEINNNINELNLNLNTKIKNIEQAK